MVNYQNGKIYAIRSFKTDEIYIGSTTQKLCQRLQKHKANKKCYEKGYHNYVTSYKILDYEDVYIELIENVPCNSKEELLKKEGEYIREMICVNKINPAPMTKEIKKQKNKEYHEKNKEAIKQQRKEYREKNKEAIKQKKKKYYEKNIDFVKQKSKEYYEKAKQKVKCPHCEKEIRKDSMKRHIKSIH